MKRNVVRYLLFCIALWLLGSSACSEGTISIHSQDTDGDEEQNNPDDDDDDDDSDDEDDDSSPRSDGDDEEDAESERLGRIRLEPTQWDIGAVYMETSNETTLRVGNVGSGPLLVSRFTIEDRFTPCFDVQWTDDSLSFPITLEENEDASLLVTYTFSGCECLLDETLLALQSDDPQNPEVNVSIFRQDKCVCELVEAEGTVAVDFGEVAAGTCERKTLMFEPSCGVRTPCVEFPIETITLGTDHSEVFSFENLDTLPGSASSSDPLSFDLLFCSPASVPIPTAYVDVLTISTGGLDGDLTLPLNGTAIP